MLLTTSTATAINAGLAKEDIVADLFPRLDFAPQGALLVDYEAHADHAVALGNTLPTATTQDAPQFHYQSFGDMDTAAKYTLVMTDPDAPSRTDKKFSEYCHYVVTDVQFADSKGGAIVPEEFNVAESYIGPGPPKGTGLHRYIFLLLKQPQGVSGAQFSKVKERFNWGYGQPGVGIDRWAKENGLTLLAANYFLAENK
ncbi:Tfs1 protein [Maudiozyma humilis]|uniref:Tfs1 protein n=1 Tax=Maudiozyma humilis TaxID=51915 RepID=A0AAV5S0Q5_MAUHU|nr:Tfs1 protein [Kazachstania humilis]